MMRLLTVILTASVVFGAANASATDADLGKVKMKLGHHKMGGAPLLGKTIRDTVVEYMLEMGDITQQEIDVLRAERKSDFDEMRALRESGDRAAMKAKHQQIREKHQVHKEKIRAYIENNPELREKLRQATKQTREKMKRKFKKKRRKALMRQMEAESLED